MITSRTRLTIAITNDASRAQPKPSTLKDFGSIDDASSSISGSSTSAARNPSANVNGSLSAATIGGSTAFSAAISTAVTAACEKVSTVTCGTNHAATNTAIVATS